LTTEKEAPSTTSAQAEDGSGDRDDRAGEVTNSLYQRGKSDPCLKADLLKR